MNLFHYLWNKSMEILLCRICLVENVTMLPIAKTPLQEIYEKLTEMKLETNTSRPNNVCYMCFARLQNCYHLRNSCLQSEEILTQMLLSNTQTLPSKPKTVPKLNLKITPSIKMSICDVVCERGGVESSNEVQIKTEPSLTEEIYIKMEEHDTSDAEEYDFPEIPVTDVKIYMDGGQGDCTDTEEYDGPEVPVTDVKIFMDEGQDDCTGDDKSDLANILSYTDDLDVNIKDEDVADDQLYLPEADDEVSEVENKRDQGAPAEKRVLTTPTSGRSSSKLQKSESAEIRKKEELLTSKFHKTNTVVVTSSLTSEYKILDKLENTTKLKKNIVTPYDVVKKSIVCSDVNINPSRRDLGTKNNFETHLLIPTTEKLYICDICNKQFHVKNTLVRHLRIHTGEKPFTCTICKKQFNRKHHLLRHFHTHTGAKPFTCNFCKKRFNQKQNLCRHLRTHTGAKPFTCNICNQQFSHKPSLVIHLRTHTGEKPFTCNICIKQFTSSSNLSRHISTHAKRI